MSLRPCVCSAGLSRDRRASSRRHSRPRARTRASSCFARISGRARSRRQDFQTRRTCNPSWGLVVSPVRQGVRQGSVMPTKAAHLGAAPPRSRRVGSVEPARSWVLRSSTPECALHTRFIVGKQLAQRPRGPRFERHLSPLLEPLRALLQASFVVLLCSL